eukprot:Lithocolla_globosa_v1_NODE_3418_length_1676_cov_397.580506.p3 type:complete len:101 gc:universal NODE_3418_length_1676_cov_397.580506:857-555(-)
MSQRKNPWITHLQAYHKAHPQLTYRQAMSAARESYVPVKQNGGFALLPKDPLTAGLELGTQVVKSGTDLTGQILYKKQMSKGKVPQMTDEQIWAFVTQVR